MKKYNVSFELIKEKVQIKLTCIDFEVYREVARFGEYTTGQILEYKTNNIKNLKIEEEQNKWKTL